MKLRQLDESMISYEKDEQKNILIAANSQDKLELEINNLGLKMAKITKKIKSKSLNFIKNLVEIK